MTARVVVAGLGDLGLLAAIGLARHRRLIDVVAVSTKPGLVSAKDLGLRLARPDEWARYYRIAHNRYRGLDHTRIVHGAATGLDLADRSITVRRSDGTTVREPFDHLVIATGTRNGAWRRPTVQDDAEIETDLRDPHARVAAATRVAVVGGGPTAVGAAAQIAHAFPGKHVHLYFPGEHALPRHPPRTWPAVRSRLEDLGVGLHASHRAVLPPDAAGTLTAGPVTFSTGQPPAPADLVLWAVGGGRPNTGWLPPALLDAEGFVRVQPDLRVTGTDGVWAVGDVAATDPLRASARNNGHALLTRNIVATLRGRSTRAFRAPTEMQGSVLGPLDDRLTMYLRGGNLTIPIRNSTLHTHLVQRLQHRGVRRA